MFELDYSLMLLMRITITLFVLIDYSHASASSYTFTHTRIKHTVCRPQDQVDLGKVCQARERTDKPSEQSGRWGWRWQEKGRWRQEEEVIEPNLLCGADSQPFADQIKNDVRCTRD